MDEKNLKDLQAATQHLKEAELILRSSRLPRLHAHVIEVLKKANTLVAIANNLNEDRNNEHN
jgi:hypothetical protein